MTRATPKRPRQASPATARQAKARPAGQEASQPENAQPAPGAVAPIEHGGQEQPHPFVECHNLGEQFIVALMKVAYRSKSESYRAKYLAAAQAVRSIVTRLENPLIVVSRDEVDEVAKALAADLDDETKKNLTAEIATWPTMSPDDTADEIRTMPEAAAKLGRYRRGAEKGKGTVVAKAEEKRLKAREIFDKYAAQGKSRPKSIWFTARDLEGATDRNAIRKVRRLLSRPKMTKG